jgi:hypothetical protein
VLGPLNSLLWYEVVELEGEAVDALPQAPAARSVLALSSPDPTHLTRMLLADDTTAVLCAACHAHQPEARALAEKPARALHVMNELVTPDVEYASWKEFVNLVYAVQDSYCACLVAAMHTALEREQVSLVLGSVYGFPLELDFLKVYMEFGSYFLFLQEQIKDIIIITSMRAVQMLVYAHGLLDCVEVHPHGFQVDNRVILLGHAAVASHNVHDRHQIAQDVVENDFLIALVVEEVVLDLLMADGELELSFEAFSDLLAEAVDVDVVGVLRHVHEDLLELEVCTSRELAQAAVRGIGGRLMMILLHGRARIPGPLCGGRGRTRHADFGVK